MKRLLSVVCLSMLLVACSDPKDVVINNLEDIEANSEKLKKLPEEDKALLLRYTMRKELGKAFNNDAGIVANTKIGDAIKEQKEFEENKQKLEEEKQKQMAEIDGYAEVLFVSKSKQPEREGSYGEKQDIVFKVKNKSKKTIAGLKGVHRFYDKFGDEVYSIELKFDFKDIGGKLETSKEYTYNGVLEMNQFSDADTAFSNAKIDELKSKFFPLTVLFEDGTSVGVK